MVYPQFSARSWNVTLKDTLQKESEMKIHEGQGPLIPPNSKIGPKKGSEVNDFQKIMDQTRLPIEGKEAITGKEVFGPVPDGVQIIQGTNRTNEPVNIPQKKQVLENIKETLDIVDFYAKKLGDTSLSATGLAPLVGHLEDRLDMLKELASSPRTPEKLRSVVSDMAISIGTEVAKFKRGDYV